MAKSKAERAQEQLEHLKGILPLDGEPTAAAPTRVDAAVERAAAAVVSTRTRLARREEMEIWEKNPRRHRTRAQIRKVAASLKKDKQDETLIVRPHPDPEKRAAGILYQIITGGTRWEASAPEWADLPLLRIEVRDLDDKEALKLAWRNNKKRNDMGPLDDAYYYLELSKMEGDEESDKTLRAVAKESGVSHMRVKQFKDLLTLPEDILLAMMDAEEEDEDPDPNEAPPQPEEEKRVAWNEKHGRALLQLQLYPDTQHLLFMEIQLHTMSGNSALRRADVLLEQARQDAGLEPKPKKTRKSKGKAAEDKKEERAGGQPAPQPTPQPEPAQETPTGTPPPQAGSEGTPPTDVTPDVTPPASPASPTGQEQPAPPVQSATAGVGSSVSTGVVSFTPPLQLAPIATLTAEQRFEPAVILLEQLVASLDQQPLSIEEARRVGFLQARLRRGVEKSGAHIELVKGGP